MQSTKCERGHLEDDPFWNAKPVEADQCIGDVFGSPLVEDEPGCSILNGLQTLDETGRQVDQQTVTIVQPAEDKCNTGNGPERRMVRSWRRVAKQQETVRCTCVSIVRSASM